MKLLNNEEKSGFDAFLGINDKVIVRPFFCPTTISGILEGNLYEIDHLGHKVQVFKENLIKVAFPILIPSQHVQYLHEGAWIDCVVKSVSPETAENG